MRFALIIVIFVILNGKQQVNAQTKSLPPTVDIQQIIDDIIGTQELDLNYEQLYENLMLLLTDPIDLNKATAEQFRLLGFLSESQIINFLDYRSSNGNLLSIYELQVIPEFDLTTIDRLNHFIVVTDPEVSIDHSLLKRIISNKNNYTLLRYEHTLEEKKGFQQNVDSSRKFLGSPERLYLRYRNSRPGDFSVGLTFEKDAGESFKWEPTKQMGFDFFSFHAQLMNKGRLKNIIVGDYQVQAGQGLILGGLFGMGKGGETITSPRRSNLGGLPYTSSYENGNLRGLLATYQIKKNIYVTGFFSKAKRDASLQSDTTESYSISALQSTGLHRNKSEMVGRDAIDETNTGGIVNFKNDKLDAGVIWNTVSFSHSFDRKPAPYNQFTFNAKENHNASLFLNYSYHNFTFFSETAKSLYGGWALLAGLLGSVTPKLDISLAYRNYQRDYHTFYSSAFGEGSSVQNEVGIYWGWKYQWSKKYSFAGYMDWFRFPWLRYRSYLPSEGYEWLLRFNYQINRNTLLYIQTREESKLRNISGSDSPLYLTDQGTKRNFLFSVQLNAHRSLKLKTRVQASTYSFNNKKTSGFALMQDVRWDVGRFSLTARYSLFDTDDYDNRQYAYENDLWLAFSIPAYQGRGIRRYFLVQYKFNQHIKLWARYAHVRYTDRDEIGSGYDLIEGNTRNDLKFQLVITL